MNGNFPSFDICFQYIIISYTGNDYVLHRKLTWKYFKNGVYYNISNFKIKFLTHYGSW